LVERLPPKADPLPDSLLRGFASLLRACGPTLRTLVLCGSYLSNDLQLPPDVVAAVATHCPGLESLTLPNFARGELPLASLPVLREYSGPRPSAGFVSAHAATLRKVAVSDYDEEELVTESAIAAAKQVLEQLGTCTQLQTVEYDFNVNDHQGLDCAPLVGCKRLQRVRGCFTAVQFPLLAAACPYLHFVETTYPLLPNDPTLAVLAVAGVRCESEQAGTSYSESSDRS
jgi:hypothetical protein